MKKISNTIILSFALASLNGCGVSKTPPQSQERLPVPIYRETSTDDKAQCDDYQINKGYSGRWAASFPVGLIIDPSVPSNMQPAIANAVDVWNSHFQTPIFKILGVTDKATKPKQDYRNVIYWEKNWSGEKLQEAYTTTYWEDKSGKIVEADIIIDAKNFNFSPGHPARGQADLESVMIHELGHVLGLDHTKNVESIMYPGLVNGMERRDISDEDLENIRCGYE